MRPGCRRRAGVSILLLLAGMFACLTGCPLTVFGIPFSLVRSIEAMSRPRPEPAQLRAFSPGTTVLIAAQLPPDAATGPYNLALFHVEHRQPAHEDI